MVAKFKNWILSFDFVKEALRAAEIAAFPKAQKDILETMRDDLDKKAEELARQKLVSLLSVVDPAYVVRQDREKKLIFIGNEIAEARRLHNLKAEAEFFAQSELWKLVNETPKELAMQAMFVSGESLVDMQKGKSMLFWLKTQQNILDIFKKEL